jgi:nucleotide-binding universal stress UspA family protein
MDESASMRRALETELAIRAERASAWSDVPVEPVLRCGAAGRTIVDVTVELGADLVVLGTRGQSGLQHWMMGSTAERVVRRSNVPVLTVHPGLPGPVGVPGRVLVPVDLLSDPASVLLALGRVFGESVRESELVLVHCARPPVHLQGMGEELGLERLGLSLGPGPYIDALEHVACRLRREGYTVEAVACEGEPARLIPRLAAERSIDLIAMQTRGLTGLAHLILGSTAERVVQRAHCPVLTVHRSRARTRARQTRSALDRRVVSSFAH